MPQFDYRIQQPNLGGALASGLQFGAQMKNNRIKQEQHQAKLVEQAEMEDYMVNLSGNITTKSINDAILKYPHMAKNFQMALDNMKGEQREQSLNEASRVHSSLRSGNIPLAKRILEDNAIAFENAGDMKAAQSRRDLIETIDMDPSGAEFSTGAFLSTALGPDKYAENYEKLDQMDVKKGKMKADLNKAEAELKEMSAVDGKIPPSKRTDAETKLRSEYSKETKVFKDITNAYGRIKSSHDNAAGDLSLIFAYMKMLDPGSTVREGEFATVQNAGGVSDKVMNIYNKISTGQRLTSGQRKAFKGQAEALFKTAKKSEDKVRKGLTRIANNGGLNLENVFYEDVITGPMEDATQTQPTKQVLKSGTATGESDAINNFIREAKALGLEGFN